MQPSPQSIALRIVYLHEMLEDEKTSEAWLFAIWGTKGWMKLVRGPLGATPALVEFGNPLTPRRVFRVP